MANKFNNNRNNSNSMQDLDRDIRDAEKEVAIKRALKRRKCYHSQVSGAHLIPISEYKGMSPKEKQKYTDTTYVCDNCDEIIETAFFSHEEVNNLFFNVRSMLNQIQMLTGAKLDDEDREELDAAFEKVNYLEALMGNFYNDMVRALSKQDNGGKGKKNSKGGIGISSGMMQ